jgi:hypothetical protein
MDEPPVFSRLAMKHPKSLHERHIDLLFKLIGNNRNITSIMMTQPDKELFSKQPAFYQFLGKFEGRDCEALGEFASGRGYRYDFYVLPLAASEREQSLAVIPLERLYNSVLFFDLGITTGQADCSCPEIATLANRWGHIDMVAYEPLLRDKEKRIDYTIKKGRWLFRTVRVPVWIVRRWGMAFYTFGRG